jgi:hypothetical protein
MEAALGEDFARDVEELTAALFGGKSGGQAGLRSGVGSGRRRVVVGRVPAQTLDLSGIS